MTSREGAHLPESLVYMRLGLKTTFLGGAFWRALEHSFFKKKEIS